MKVSTAEEQEEQQRRKREVLGRWGDPRQMLDGRMWLDKT
jgi:hypothetical protein